ncbi:GIY-YIG nuclease family protein [Massilia sp. Mn16-1_5]|uniref:GIY-YIG nuclease family protein n=1 Tax=Massilia sp. Mn16-1_5 TaxID=2079199 RepID=UPI00109ED67A|nr:GIY-YIG nuclease family protein [Massilia sp. Mn16-1_5]THC44332.1 hypothetical protein C2862_10720 [Massilia sp. Mn16-1_5]
MHIDQNLLDLLAEQGINPEAQQITLMRHADKRYPLVKYIGTRALNLYQAVQPRRMPEGSLVASFFGHRPGHGLLLGVWRVQAVMPAGEAVRQGLTAGSFEPLHEEWTGYFHDLQETGFLAEQRLKLEIKWLGKELAWRRVLYPADAATARASYPVSIRQECAIPFGGLAGASLVMSELKIALQDAAWQQGLLGISAIYLITDERSGAHYIGSASGRQGLLSRWGNYAASGHGGNIRLMQLLADNPGRELDFRFTVLEVLPADLPKRAVILRESYWKIALGSRVFGLNLN